MRLTYRPAPEEWGTYSCVTLRFARTFQAGTKTKYTHYTHNTHVTHITHTTSHTQPRKGWDVLLEAYLSEFSAADDVELHILTKPFGRSGTKVCVCCVFMGVHICVCVQGFWEKVPMWLGQVPPPAAWGQGGRGATCTCICRIRLATLTHSPRHTMHNAHIKPSSLPK